MSKAFSSVDLWASPFWDGLHSSFLAYVDLSVVLCFQPWYFYVHFNGCK